MPIQGSDVLTKFSLQPLANRLGVEGIVTATLVPRVVPVAVVDGSIQAIGLQTLDVPFTAGEQVAPAANTRLANTGALVAGQYNITIWACIITDTNSIRIRRRNAGDSADIWAMRTGGANSVGISLTQISIRMVFAANEFLVVENVGAGAAGTVYQAAIWVQGPF